MNRWQSHPLTDKAKAKYLTRSLAEIFSRPVIERAYIYQLADRGPRSRYDRPAAALRTDHQRPDEDDGLLRDSQHHAVALRHRIRPQPTGAERQDVRQHAEPFARSWLQKSSGVFDLVLWQEVASYEQPKLKNALQAREWTPQAQGVTLDFGEPIAQVRTYLPTALDGDPDWRPQAQGELRPADPDHSGRAGRTPGRRDHSARRDSARIADQLPLIRRVRQSDMAAKSVWRHDRPGSGDRGNVSAAAALGTALARPHSRPLRRRSRRDVPPMRRRPVPVRPTAAPVRRTRGPPGGTGGRPRRRRR